MEPKGTDWAKYSWKFMVVFLDAYHYARADRYAPSAVCIWNNVSEADTEEGDCYQPHGVE